MRRLVRLQEIAFQIRDIEQTEATLPERLATLERVFAERIEEIGAARLRHEALVQQQQRLTSERDDLQNRLRQAQQKLMQVNNQREYSAVLNEIDSYKATSAGIDDRILECDSQIESLAAPAAEADARIGEERARVEQAKGELTREHSENATRLADLSRQRGELAHGLSADTLRRFDSIFKARGGVAMARIEKESCAACHVRLRPQVINLARRGDELITCDSCRRILYVEDEGDGTETAADAGPGRGAEAGR